MDVEEYVERTGLPAATAEDEARRCPIDGGALADEGDEYRCERCGLDAQEARDAATGDGRFELVAVYQDGNPETWARFDDPALALDVAARLRRSMRIPFVGVGDRERDGHGWIDEDDLAEES